MNCKECDGLGQILDAPGNVLGGRCYWETCPDCKGTGSMAIGSVLHSKCNTRIFMIFDRGLGENVLYCPNPDCRHDIDANDTHIEPEGPEPIVEDPRLDVLCEHIETARIKKADKLEHGQNLRTSWDREDNRPPTAFRTGDAKR